MSASSKQHSFTTAPHRPSRQSLVIIGGGFSGASLAYHLAALVDPHDVQITIIEPREMLGAGLAYSTDEAAFRLNVLAERMSIFYEDKPHFFRWMSEHNSLQHDEEARMPSGQIYARRTLFGRYMAAQIQPLLDSGRVRHLKTYASGAQRLADNSYRITTDSGETLDADLLVIAASHPLPALPAALKPLQTAANPAPQGLMTNPYQTGAIAQLLQDKGKHCAVLIVGAGLTSADMVAGLSQHGHQGPITVLSRHGLRSRSNLNLQAGEPAPPRLFGDFIHPPLRSATGLLQRIRRTIDEAAEQNVPWQAVIDRLRDQGEVIWQALPVAERKRIVRHLRSYWDAHRFRLAAQTDQVLDQRCRNQSLKFIAAHLTKAEPANAKGGFTVSYRLRTTPQVVTEQFDAIIITTGPAHGDIIAQCPPLAMLHDAQLLDIDPTGLGLHTSTTMQAIDQSGAIVDNLFIAGPLARGTFGELMGAPEVTRYTQNLAQQLAQNLSQNRAHNLATDLHDKPSHER